LTGRCDGIPDWRERDLHQAQALRQYVLSIALVPQILLRLAGGLMHMLMSPLLAVFGLRRFKRNALAGGKQFFKCAGVLTGLMQARPGARRQF